MPKAKIALLQPAVDGFKQYLTLTVPSIKRFAQNPDGPLSFGGETLETAKQKLDDAAAAAKALADAYRTTGGAAEASAADADAVLFAAPLGLMSVK